METGGGIFLGIGSNIEPGKNIMRMFTALKHRVQVVRISSLYRSAPQGNPDQPDFINGAAEIRTSLTPRELKFEVLRQIEADLGRIRTSHRNAPRPMDLDILLYRDLVTDEEELKIPDPGIYNYPFVYIPLLELEPGLILPGSGKKLEKLLEEKHHCHNLRKLVELTRKVRELI